MVNPGKPKSKRTPVRLRHKIEKASAAKKRKQQKAAKNNPEWRSRLKKDPGIPNLFPYKDKILAEILEKRAAKEAEAKKKRGEARQRRAALETGIVDNGTTENLDADLHEEHMEEHMEEDGMSEDESSNPMAALLASAKARAVTFDREDGMDVDEEMEEDGYNGLGDVLASSDIPLSRTQKDSSRRAFDKIFKEVVAAADIVLYVLDARDPEGTRSKEVERMIMAAESGQKRLILVLNKIDLVPSKVLKSWLIYLRRYFPTLPLRAASPAPNAQTFKHPQLTPQTTSTILFNALKSFASTTQLKRAITVGVIGYPNVGKSSVINILTSRLGRSSNSCPVGAEAGVTTSMREVKLDGKLKLLDSPGIVFPASANSEKITSSEEQARLVLLNAVPPKQIADPVSAVALLLKRLSSSEETFAKLMEVYGIPPLVATNGDLTMDFLIQVARKRGRLGKGGVPNILSAASTVITDWRDGRIQGWNDPPLLPLASNSTVDGSIADGDAGDHKLIVTEWAKEFKIEGLWGDEGAQERDEMNVDS
ncbi:MAG: hypothetical protein M1829_005954 [Trizodia sp. TS-e1964]|nr:MAG: hypothetical protein M1829_005954 [Trizodia sp. TS-e1964]